MTPMVDIQAVGGLGWVSLSLRDEHCYNDCFNRANATYSYENNWAFIQQETRLCGLTYHHDGHLLTATVKDLKSPFIFVMPTHLNPNTSVSELVQICLSLKQATGRRVVLRRVTDDLQELLLTSTHRGHCLAIDPIGYTCSRDMPEDLTPQVVVSTNAAASLPGAQFAKIRNHIKHFAASFSPSVRDLSPGLASSVKKMIGLWTQQYNSRADSRHDPNRPANLSIDESAYTLFADLFAPLIDNNQYFGKTLVVNEEVVGFAFAGRTSRTSAALYCRISLLNYSGIAEYLMSTLFNQLTQSGVQYLNFGGAETESLHRHKLKYGPHALRKVYDLEIV